ncbi:MAG: argininosuccinate synthase [Candidatus Bathyarchaeia archaeon]
MVLAYSGGLDTSVLIKLIQEKHESAVVTVTLDVGQLEDLKEIEDRAKSVGSVKHYSFDARREFVEGYVFPALKANALYEGKYPLASALSRPLISSKLVEVAKKENAWAVAHGSTGKGNDQARFDITIKALAPDLKVLAPVREWNLSRDEEIEYAKKHGIPVSTEKKKYSIDQNLWGRSIEAGPLESLEHEPPADAFGWTVPPEKAPDTPEYITLHYDAGVPTALDGKEMEAVELLRKLTDIGGRHSIGRIDQVEDRIVGIKSREVYECPAATMLIEAHRDLEKLTLTRHELMLKQQLEQQWTWLVYAGLWCEPLREDVEAFINKTQERVVGDVKLKLYKGTAMPVGRSSPNPLYVPSLASYGIAATFNQSLAAGFVELWGLPTVVASRAKTDRPKKRKPE